MRSIFLGGSMMLALLLVVQAGTADDALEQAIKKDRQRIAGTWRVMALTVNGNKAELSDAQQMKVVNGEDGSWSVQIDGKEVSRGTSVFDPTKKPKTIDFTATSGSEKGKKFLGIYTLGKNRRRLCFAPSGAERPTEFSSTAENKHLLVIFKRVDTE